MWVHKFTTEWLVNRTIENAPRINRHTPTLHGYYLDYTVSSEKSHRSLLFDKSLKESHWHGIPYEYCQKTQKPMYISMQSSKKRLFYSRSIVQYCVSFEILLYHIADVFSAVRMGLFIRLYDYCTWRM